MQFKIDHRLNIKTKTIKLFKKKHNRIYLQLGASKMFLRSSQTAITQTKEKKNNDTLEFLKLINFCSSNTPLRWVKQRPGKCVCKTYVCQKGLLQLNNKKCKKTHKVVKDLNRHFTEIHMTHKCIRDFTIINCQRNTYLRFVHILVSLLQRNRTNQQQVGGGKRKREKKSGGEGIVKELSKNCKGWQVQKVKDMLAGWKPAAEVMVQLTSECRCLAGFPLLGGGQSFFIFIFSCKASN